MQVLVFIAGLAALVSCLQASFQPGFAAMGKSGLSVSAADVVLLAGAVTLAILAMRRDVRIKRLVPGWAVLCVLAATLVSFIAGPSAAGVKEIIQLIEILWVGYVLFRVAVREGKGEELISDLLLAAAAITALIALYQRLFRGVGAFEAGGLLENRNYLAAYLILTVPWAVGRYLAPRANARWGERVATGLLVPAAFFLSANVIVSLALLAGVVIAVSGADAGGLIAGARQKVTLLALVLAWVIITAASGTVAPGGVWEGFAVYRKGAGGMMKPSARARRWQADLTAVAENPWLGLGPGCYQNKISPYYRYGVIKPDGRTDDVAGFDIRADEPGTQSLWEVIPVEGGLLLTAAWVVMLTGGIVAAFRNGRPGIAGALIAAMLGGAVITVWVRGVGVALAFLLALSGEKRQNGQKG